MKIKTNSIHAKIYRFVYSSDLPMNLCPYFWSLIWAIVVFIPDLIIKLPVLLWNLTTDTNQKTEKKEQSASNAFRTEALLRGRTFCRLYTFIFKRQESWGVQ